MSASKRMLELLLKNVGEEVDRNELSKVAQVHDWGRALRSLRQIGWEIQSTQNGYILLSETKKESNKKREHISTKLRYEVLHRDESTCQRCGRSASKDGVTLHVDHKTPVEWGGKTVLDNLWTLCSSCNEGKKHWFSDQDADKMKEIMNSDSGYGRLVNLFENYPNEFISSTKISVIAGIQDWPRTVRHIRDKYNMNIKPINSNGEQGYIYIK